MERKQHDKMEKPITWYPPTYTPPTIDEEPNELVLEQPDVEVSHPRAPMVEKHEKPIDVLHHVPTTHEIDPVHEDWFREEPHSEEPQKLESAAVEKPQMKGESKIFHEPAGPFETEKEEQEWAVKKNLRAINERG